MFLLLFCDTRLHKAANIHLTLFITWAFDHVTFFWGVGQLARLWVLTKALVFSFLASVQGYSSSKVNFSSVLKQAGLWPECAQSFNLPLRYSNHLTDACKWERVNVHYKLRFEFWFCILSSSLTSKATVLNTSWWWSPDTFRLHEMSAITFL